MMNERRARVMYKNMYAGDIWQNDDGYFFMYDTTYVQMKDAHYVSLSLPLQEGVYKSQVLFPFFDGLIPEGWLLDVAIKNWKVDVRDRMGLLMCGCNDCIGAVTIVTDEGKVL